MIKKIIILFLITMIPAFELRASIPFGILSGTVNLPFDMSVRGMGENWVWVFVVCVISNFILGAILYPLLDKILLMLERIPIIGKFWNKAMMRTQKKIHPYVERWGTIGVALFIAVPLPGSGTYSGALGAFMLGMSYRRFLLANAIGVLLAGIAVTAVTLSGKGFIQMLFS